MHHEIDIDFDPMILMFCDSTAWLSKYKFNIFGLLPKGLNKLTLFTKDKYKDMFRVNITTHPDES